MLVNKNYENSIIDIRNDKGILVLQMKFIDDKFLVFLCEPIIITKDDNEELYNELDNIIDNDYYFASPYSTKDNNTIIWTSDESYNTEDNLDLNGINRLIIKKENDEFRLCYSNPYYDRNILPKQYGLIFFSTDENGQKTRNLKTNSTFQNDMIRLFRNLLNKNKVLEK